MRHNLTLSLVFLLFLLLFSTSENRLWAQNRGSLFTVNDIGDSSDAVSGDGICADTNGRCSLRAAIEESKSSPQSNAIIFNLSQPSVINLTLGELLISKGLAIAGPGARRLTIRRSPAPGTPNFRIFHVPAGQIALSISGLTINNGNAASGEAGGAFFGETGSTVGLTDVVVVGNHASVGGGIAVFGTLNILRSLITSNIADVNGGGLAIGAGSIRSIVTSSTFTANSGSTAGAIDNHGNLILINNTIYRNSVTTSPSSIASGSDGNVQVLNSIIGNDSPSNVNSLSGSFVSLGNNIVTDARGSAGFVNGVNGDQVSDNNAVDPRLGTLVDNGGQSDTLASLTGSPAIGNANGCILNGNCPQLPGIFVRGMSDQRRVNRRGFTTGVDIGAFNKVDGMSIGVVGIGIFLFPSSQIIRYAGSPMVLTNVRTLEKRYIVFRPMGSTFFSNLVSSDDYALEILSKRRGLVTPQVFILD